MPARIDPLSVHLFSPDRAQDRLLIASLIGVIVMTIVAFQGIIYVDRDFPIYFQGMVAGNHVVVPTGRHFLFEGVLDDGVAWGLTGAGLTPFAVQAAWTVGGLVCMIATLVYSVHNKTISLVDLILVLAFSRLVDTCSAYIGRFDPLLISFLVLSANRSRWVSIAGAMAAALCHPLVALVSTAGVAILCLAFEGRWRILQAAATALAVLANYAALHLWFPTMTNRLDFAQHYFWDLIRNNARWGLPTLISSLLVPILSIQVFRPRPNLKLGWPGAALLAWLVGVVLITCVLTLDHTRDVLLVTIAPLIVYLRASPRFETVGLAEGRFAQLFVVLFLARLVIPNINAAGFLFMHYHALAVAFSH